jgi:hypothetical protein
MHTHEILNLMEYWKHCHECGAILVTVPGGSICPHCGFAGSIGSGTGRSWSLVSQRAPRWEHPSANSAEFRCRHIFPSIPRPTMAGRSWPVWSPHTCTQACDATETLGETTGYMGTVLLTFHHRFSKYVNKLKPSPN